MLDLVRTKARAVAVTAAGVLIALQILLPTVLDLVVGSIVVGLVWISARIGRA